MAKNIKLGSQQNDWKDKKISVGRYEVEKKKCTANMLLSKMTKMCRDNENKTKSILAPLVAGVWVLAPGDGLLGAGDRLEAGTPPPGVLAAGLGAPGRTRPAGGAGARTTVFAYIYKKQNFFVAFIFLFGKT